MDEDGRREKLDFITAFFLFFCVRDAALLHGLKNERETQLYWFSSSSDRSSLLPAPILQSLIISRLALSHPHPSSLLSSNHPYPCVHRECVVGELMKSKASTNTLTASKEGELGDWEEEIFNDSMMDWLLPPSSLSSFKWDSFRFNMA